MIKRHIYFFVLIFFVSMASHASESVWKQSQQLEAEGNYEKAAAVIKSWAMSNDEYGLLRYAYLKYKQGEYNDAIKFYEKAIKLNTSSIDAKLGITLPYMAQQRWRQVKVYTRQILVRADWNKVAHQRLMLAEQKTKKWHTLNRHADKVSRVYPADAKTLLYYAHAKAKQGDTPLATAAYKKVLMRDPDNSEASHYLEDH